MKGKKEASGEGKNRGKFSSPTLSPLAKYLSDLKPRLMLKALQRGLSHNPKTSSGFTEWIGSPPDPTPPPIHPIPLYPMLHRGPRGREGWWKWCREMREEGDKMRELEGMRSTREHKGKDNRAGVLEEAGKEGKGGKRMGRRRERRKQPGVSVSPLASRLRCPD